MNDPRLPFDVKFRISDKELVLTYDVRNASERDVYLLNRVFSLVGFRLDPNIIYIHLERDQKTIWLNKMIPRIPEGQSPTAPVAPFVTPVRAGTTFHEEVHVPLPISEFRAYEGPSKDPKVVRYQKVRFSLQYAWRTEGTVEEIRDLEAGRVVIPRGGAVPQPSDVGLLESKIVPLDIPVLEGSD